MRVTLHNCKPARKVPQLIMVSVFFCDSPPAPAHKPVPMLQARSMSLRLSCRVRALKRACAVAMEDRGGGGGGSQTLQCSGDVSASFRKLVAIFRVPSNREQIKKVHQYADKGIKRSVREIRTAGTGTKRNH